MPTVYIEIEQGALMNVYSDDLDDLDVILVDRDEQSHEEIIVRQMDYDGPPPQTLKVEVTDHLNR